MASDEPVFKEGSAMTDSERQSLRRSRITDAGLVQRKVIGHADDFAKIHEYAKKLYEKRGIKLTAENKKNK